MRKFKVTPRYVFLFAALILVVYFVANCATLLISPISGVEDREFEFRSTLEEALGRREGMIEVIFLDEHEDNGTIFYAAPNWLGQTFHHVSHFVRKTQGDDVIYAVISTQTGGGSPLSSNPESIELHRRLISGRLPPGDNPLFIDAVYRTINRRPLYGISQDPNIFNLNINGQAPDHVMVSNVRPARRALGEEGDMVTIYLWYFADFQFKEGDEIVISFAEAF